jgi:hypothetical protein
LLLGIFKSFSSNEEGKDAGKVMETKTFKKSTMYSILRTLLSPFSVKKKFNDSKLHSLISLYQTHNKKLIVLTAMRERVEQSLLLLLLPLHARSY